MGGQTRLIALVAMATFGWAFIAWAPSGGSATTSPPRTSQDTQAAANNDAAALLGLTPLPQGAAVTSADPSGGALGMPAQSVATPNLVDVPRWWLVPGQPDATLSYITSHPPTGAKPSGSGFYTTPHGVAVRVVGFGWPPQRGVLGSRSLLVGATSAPNGQTAVRADAEVVWVQPRPADENVPSGARVLTVRVEHRGRRARSVTVSKRRIVEQLATVLDSLETVQPGSTACPGLVAVNNAPVITFRFSASASGRSLATAHESLSPPAPIAGPCNPIALTINGRSRRPLLDPTGTTIRTATKLLGRLP